MSARADDRIYRVPLDSLLDYTGTGRLVHPCPPTYPRDSYGWQFREQLDPMALGTCRYCGERLPMSPDKETEQSALSS